MSSNTPSTRPAPTSLGRLTRRGFLGAGAAAATVPWLAGCAQSTGPAAAGATQDLSATEPELAVSNWAQYIDTELKDRSSHPTVTAFEEKTGIDVTYTEDIADNEEFFLKLRPILEAGKSTQRDLVILTDWMAARMIALDYVEPLDRGNIPNGKNLIESLQSPPFDTERAYSMPWQSGFTAIGYNEDVVESPVVSMSELLTRPDLRGRVAVFTEMRDTTGLIMLDQGADPANFTDEQFDAALAVLQEAVDSGHTRSFANANYGQALSKGDLAATMTYSGDIFQLAKDNPSLKLSKPEAGFILWSDNMLIPKGSPHRANAERWMNWYYDPEIAAQLSAWVNFISPVNGAREAMERIDPELASNPLIFPSPEDLAGGAIYRALSADEEQRFGAAFTEVRGV